MTWWDGGFGGITRLGKLQLLELIVYFTEGYSGLLLTLQRTRSPQQRRKVGFAAKNSPPRRAFAAFARQK